MGTKLIKGLANFLKLSGGTMTGDLDMGDNDISDVKSIAFNDGDATITEVKDEDDMASDSNTMIATQQSIKAYTDSVASGKLSLSGGTMTGEIVMPVATSAPVDAPANGTVRIVDLGTGRTRYYFYVYLNGGWRSEVLS